jgi:C_GCAxxG_C_C family probable redox protein
MDMDNVERAKSYRENGFNCAQATFASCSRAFGVDPELALKVSGLFGAGISKTGETCGAVSGGLMALGLKYAMVNPDELQAKAKSYQIGKEFIAKFKERNQYITCKELLNCDISTPEGEARAKLTKVQDALCPGFIQDAVEIFYAMIAAE